MRNFSVIDLPDVNVWVALASPTHQFHASARTYWETQGPGGVAFCRVTMMGMLRLITDPKVMNGVPFSIPEAWEVYQTFRSFPEVQFFAESPELEAYFRSLEFSHKLWTDAYLAAFAMAGGYRIVSFDTDFGRFPDLDWLLLKNG